MTKDMEWVLKDLQMEIFMKVNIKKEKCMGKVNIHGSMENTMMDSG
jgi:5'(3')-deoxyribonucleotidase